MDQKRIVIELKTGKILEASTTFETGEFDFNNSINIENVVELPEGKQIKGQFRFYKNEITNIRLIDVEKAVEIKEDNKANNKSNVIALDSAEFHRLKELTQNYLYLPVIDKRYLDITAQLWNFDNIGVVGLGAKFGRINNISLLVLSTWNKVYIFDILLMNRKSFPIELKALLESKHIKKIIHNSRGLVDCLSNCHKVDCNNIFDTQIADYIIQKEAADNIKIQDTRMLGAVLAHYFNFPTSLLEGAESTPLKKWSERPLSNLQKMHASLMAAHLISLKNKLEKLMLKNFYKIVDGYSHELVNCDAFEVPIKVKETKLSDDIQKLFID